MPTSLDILHLIAFKILYCILCGGIIGLERERKNKTAGIKTHILICLGSMIFVTCGLILGTSQPNDGALGRIVSYIISGVGFLGAGSILNPSSDKIVGLTTAAMIWNAAGLGVLIGLGYGQVAAALALVIVVITTTVGFIEKRFMHKDQDSE